MKANTKILHTNELHQIVPQVAKLISQKLQEGSDVSWFLSGGSSIDLEVDVRKAIELQHYKGKLHICLVDERFGSVGHQASNWQQLTDHGFEFDGCIAHPVLTDGEQPHHLSDSYSKLVSKLLETTYSIAIFGIGSDGHTAGLLPFNPLMDGNSYYGNYRAKDFVRISATPLLIPELEETVVYANGSQKEQALHAMIQEGSIDRIPARILLQAKQLIIVTDQPIERGTI